MSSVSSTVGAFGAFDQVDDYHYVRSSQRLKPPFPAGLQYCVFAAGCFWGTEKGFWRLPGVYSTAVGYVGGDVAKPTYRQVCSGGTGHTEGTLVVWDPKQISLADLLRRFLDCHDPTQGNRQGRDRGTQYRSGVFTADEEQATVVRAALRAFGTVLLGQPGGRSITTEVSVGHTFWFAESKHQQYLAKPGARKYCSAEPTGQPVPPLDSWGLPPEVATKYAPLLPERFWGSFNGSIHTADTPVKLDRQSLAQVQALHQKQQQALIARAADGDVDVLIRYCGGCGFKPRARALATQLQAADQTLCIRQLQDIGASGRFDVEIRRGAAVSADGDGGGGGDSGSGGSSFTLVHSRKRGDGFVNSMPKLERILAALVEVGRIDVETLNRAMRVLRRLLGGGAAAPPPPPLPVPPAGASATDTDAAADVATTASHTITVAGVGAALSNGCATASGPKLAGAKLPVVGPDSLMAQKAHGTSPHPVQRKLRYGGHIPAFQKMADRICSFNRHAAEPHNSWRLSGWLRTVDHGRPVTYYDSVTGKPLFMAPVGRTFEEFIAESRRHGWPSFRDEEVVWENVRCLADGECVSIDGTHLGHNLPSGSSGLDFSGANSPVCEPCQGRSTRSKRNRYCINLVSIAGNPSSRP